MNVAPLTVPTSLLKQYYSLVATYNADPFAVENDDVLEEILSDMGEYSYLYVYGCEDFPVFCNQLDGNIRTYSMIFRANGIMVGVLSDQ